MSPPPPSQKRGGGGAVNYAEIPRPYAHELVEGESQMRHLTLFLLFFPLCSNCSI